MVREGMLPPGPGHRGTLWWQFDEPRPAVSSASVGGGAITVSWVLNIGVHHDYRRTDLDDHASALAQEIGLPGSGAAMFTAATVGDVAHADEGGAQAWATVGVTRPTWPADRSQLATAGQRLPGTINALVVVPAHLTPGGLVQAAMASVEAKAQACIEAGLTGTGTASDAVVVVGAAGTRAGMAEPFGGVRSVWGSRVALAVHAAVARGLAREGSGGT